MINIIVLCVGVEDTDQSEPTDPENLDITRQLMDYRITLEAPEKQVCSLENLDIVDRAAVSIMLWYTKRCSDHYTYIRRSWI